MGTVGTLKQNGCRDFQNKHCSKDPRTLLVPYMQFKNSRCSVTEIVPIPKFED